MYPEIVSSIARKKLTNNKIAKELIKYPVKKGGDKMSILPKIVLIVVQFYLLLITMM